MAYESFDAMAQALDGRSLPEGDLVQTLLDNFHHLQDGPAEASCAAVLSRDQGPQGSAPAAAPAVHTACTRADARKRRPNRNRPPPPRQPDMRCAFCSGSAFLRDDRHADIVCVDCGTCVPDQLTCEAHKCMPYEDYAALRSWTSSAKKNAGYRPANYFAQLLAQFNGRGSYKPDEQLLRDVRAKLGGASAPSGACVRTALKLLKLGKLYSHANTIAAALHGRGRDSVAYTDHRLDARLLSMFNRIVAVYERLPGARKNLLNSKYIMWQLFGLVGREDLQEHLTLLKCRTRLKWHDIIWQEVCANTGWAFTPVSCDSCDWDDMMMDESHIESYLRWRFTRPTGL